MARRSDGIPYRALGISLAISTLLLTAGLLVIEHLTLAHATRRLLWPLTRLLGFIGAGLVAGQLIEAAGWTRYLAVLAGPLFRFGRLGPHCSATFTTAFFSGVAANAMLWEFFKEGRITRRQLFLTNFVNQLPTYFLHLPTTFFIVIPLTGRAGALYFLLTFLAAVLRTLFFLVYGRFRASAPAEEKTAPAGDDRRQPDGNRWEGLWQGIRRKFPARLTQVAVYVVPIYAVAGLPPSSGFIGKVLLLQAATTGQAPWVWTIILAGGLLGLWSLARCGSSLFWKTEGVSISGASVSWTGLAPALALLLAGFALAVMADPVARYAGEAAAQLINPEAYIQAVLGGGRP